MNAINHNSSLNNAVDNILHACKRELRSIGTWHLSFAARDKNRVTDFLAKSLTAGHRMVIHDQPAEASRTPTTTPYGRRRGSAPATELHRSSSPGASTRLCASGTLRKLTSLRTNTGHCLGVVSVASHPTRRIAASASMDSYIRVFDVDSNRTIATLEAPPSEVLAIIIQSTGPGSLSGSLSVKYGRLSGTNFDLSIPRPESLARKCPVALLLENVDSAILDFVSYLYFSRWRMSSKLESRKKIGQNPGTGKLLNDIESISKALSLDKAQPRRLMSTVSSRSKSVGKTHLPDSKSKAKGANKDLLEDVHWKRRDGELTTRAVRVVQGVAEFEEQLTYSCFVHGSGNGPHHSAKYEAKHFLLYVSICGTPEIDLGKHRVDLTRLLPLTLEELEDEKSTGRWTTSYRLSGKARGATINVSFGYYVIGNNSTVLPASKDVHALQNLRKSGPSGSVALFTESEQTTARRAGSLPASSSASSWSVEDIKELHEVLPVPMSELSESVNVLYRKLEEEKLDASVNEKLEIDVISNAPESLELSSKELEKPGIQTMDAVHHSVEGCFVSDNVEVSTEVEAQLQTLPKEIGCNKDELPVCDLEFEEKEKCNNELIMEELDSALDTVSDLVNEESDSRDDSEIINQDNYLGVQADINRLRKGNPSAWMM
nr:protein PLASTID MOVEMENT IMPAIRED 1-RELATED 1-like [Ipomoea batatas]